MKDYFAKSLTARSTDEVADIYGMDLQWSAAGKIDSPYLPDGDDRSYREWLKADGAYFFYYFNPKLGVMLIFSDYGEWGYATKKLSKSETEIWEAAKIPVYRLSDGIHTRKHAEFTKFDSRPIYRAVINTVNQPVIPKKIRVKAGYLGD